MRDVIFKTRACQDKKIRGKKASPHGCVSHKRHLFGTRAIYYAKVPNPFDSQWLWMACTCLQKESPWAQAIPLSGKIRRLHFLAPSTGAPRGSQAALLLCRPQQTLSLGAGIINGVSVGLWLWSNEGETACPFQPSHKPLGPRLPESAVILRG